MIELNLKKKMIGPRIQYRSNVPLSLIDLIAENPHPPSQFLIKP